MTDWSGEVYHLIAFFGGGMFAWFITFMGSTLKKRRLEQENDELRDKLKRFKEEDDEYWEA